MFCELSIEEYNAYALKNSQNNFLQSKYMVENYILTNSIYYIVGIKKTNKVIAAALIHTFNKGKYKVFRCEKGFLIDYNNTELVNSFTKNIKRFVKEKGGVILHINPYVVLKKQSIDLTEQIVNDHIESDLKKLGYQKEKKSIQVNKIFLLDLENKTEDEVFNSFSNTTKNILRKMDNSFVKIRKLSYDELEKFKKITDYTSTKKEFKNRTLEYFQNMYKSFDKHTMFLVSEFKTSEAIDFLHKEIDLNKEKLVKIKQENKINEINIIIESLNKKINKLKEIKEDKIITSAAMFIMYGDEVTYLFSGNYDEYFEYNGAYFIQWFIMKYAIKNKYKKYNYYGISSKSVYEFKKKFDGHIEYLCGEFSIVTNHLIYPLYIFNKIIKRLLK